MRVRSFGPIKQISLPVESKKHAQQRLVPHDYVLYRIRSGWRLNGEVVNMPRCYIKYSLVLACYRIK